MMKISVIIPCYNVDRYISECIDSVVSQTCMPHEIICINDGSTDNTLRILNSLKKKHPEMLRIINSENRGASSARNAGLKIAEGEIIQFLDADDIIAADKFEKQINGFGPDVDIVVSDWTEKNDSMTQTLESYYFSEIENNPLEISIRKIVITGNPLYKTAAAKSIGGYDESLNSAQDWDFHIRLVLAGYKIKYVRGIYFIHRRVEGSLSSNWIKVSIQASEIITRLKPLLMKSDWMNTNIKQYIGRIYTDSAIYCNDKKKADVYVDEIKEWTNGDYSFINNKIKRIAVSLFGIRSVIKMQRAIK